MPFRGTSRQSSSDPGTSLPSEDPCKTSWRLSSPGWQSRTSRRPQPECIPHSDIQNSSIRAGRRRRPYSRIFRWRRKFSEMPHKGRPGSSSHPGTPLRLHRTSPCCTQGRPCPCPSALRNTVRRCPGRFLRTLRRNAPRNTRDPSRRTGRSDQRSSRSLHT